MARRIVLAVLAGAAAVAHAQQFRADGADANAYGRRENYPTCSALTYINDARCRVGALSHFDTLFPARAVKAPAASSPLRRAATEPQIAGLQQYLDTRPVSGFLIAKGDTILVERYQYARNDRHRMTSFSMAKSITSLLVGISLDEGRIRSLDDPAEAYVPELKDTEYGRTPIRHLLTMTSGVAFNEWYAVRDSDIYTLAQFTLQQGEGGAVAAVKKFNRRYAPAGQRFSYSSAESTVLGLVVERATGRNMADYAAEMLWQPLGAEADASWNVDVNGQAIGFAYFNAVLRDWARLGLMLAHGGEWNGRRIVPADCLAAATRRSDGLPPPGYGYQFWLQATERPTYSLRGLRGQWLLVDPASKLVLVQTAVRQGGDDAMDLELLAIWRGLLK